MAQDPLAVPTDELDFLAALDASETQARNVATDAPYGGTGWREDLTRRLRVLLHAEPLLAMRAADARQQPDRRHYDSLALALRVFDLVLGSMGLDYGIDRAAVHRALAPVLVAMDRAVNVVPDGERHAAVVDRVLGALRNDDERLEQFQAVYTDVRPDGVAEQVALPFRLVEDFLSPDGGTVLRLTSEAINLYLGALDRDIEDEQVAAEALIREQLERGSFAKAVRSAEYAQLQSRRYEEYIVAKIRLTRRDLQLVDWSAEMTPVLDAAHAHVRRRFTAERQILEMASDQQQHLTPGTPEAKQVATVMRLVGECCTRHARLTQTLVQSRFAFLDEQGRQGFSAAIARTRPHMVRDILEPVMRLSTQDAVVVADVTLTTVGSPHAPGLLDLNALLGWCLKPRREVSPSEVPEPERDIEAIPEPLFRFPPAVRQAADRVLRAIATPTRLSDVLRAADDHGADSALLDCITLAAHLEFGRDPEHIPVIDVVRAGHRFHVAGITGDDLVLFPRAPIRPLASDTPTPSTSRTSHD